MEDTKKITASEITPDYIDTLAADWKTAAERAAEAAAAYMDDVETRNQTTAKQIQKSEDTLSTATKERAEVLDKIRDLYSRGQEAEAKEQEKKLAAYDSRISVAKRTLSILSGSTCSGDTKLYIAAKDAAQAMKDCRTPYLEQLTELQYIVKAEIERLERVYAELTNAAGRDPGYYATAAFDRVDRHYRDLDRLKKEAAEKAAADRKAREAERGHTRYVMA